MMLDVAHVLVLVLVPWLASAVWRGGEGRDNERVRLRECLIRPQPVKAGDTETKGRDKLFVFYFCELATQVSQVRG